MTTEKPTPLAPIFDNFPSALTALPHWVLWGYALKNGKWTKVPKQSSGSNASTTNPTRLTAMRTGALEGTGFAQEIITAATELKKESCEPVRLIVLDHAGLFHGGDFNAREDVSLTMRIINHIAHETGAAVLLLAHSPKAASNADSSDAAAIAGSTTFVDQTRGAFILATMRKAEAKTLGIPEHMRQQYVSLAVVKNNYGKTGEVSWFSRTSPEGWEVPRGSPISLSVIAG